ncbi:PspA/IM30 family protein [Granulicella arctica]|uniref:PspA/IM30 family protein n=1 Tax=Granulicella arctica TaxID=940613 RepID=UPI0021DFAE4C|nr:PspA/IM30 family protein [Granulicella arctica]
MALLERVSTLLRANLNDLLAQAEDPEKLARQLVLDMENQLMQIKTEVAIAIADQHLLQKKQFAQQELHTQWLRKAELAVSKQQDDLARAALERALFTQRIAEALEQQHAEQTAETEALRAAYNRLQQKLSETQARVDLLSAQLRRSRAVHKAATTQSALQTASAQATLARLVAAVDEADSRNHASRVLLAASSETLEERFDSLDRTDKIEALLLELKERQHRLA